jgi:predicted nucleotide-binding protein
LKLPKISQNTSTETNVKGRINIVYGEETNFDKLVIEIDNDLYSEPVISQYISYRQAEIVKAMKIRSEEFE